MIKLIIEILLFMSIFQLLHSWPVNDTSTLQLIQIVHHHGEKTPDFFVKNDPFSKDINKYWPIGVGQLTLKGKFRMYKLGEFFRKSYSSFLNRTNPQQVYARSSIEHRCIESASMFLAGAFPPGKLQCKRFKMKYLTL